jgi:hypothetical protein
MIEDSPYGERERKRLAHATFHICVVGDGPRNALALVGRSGSARPRRSCTSGEIGNAALDAGDGVCAPTGPLSDSW